mmetsp:Transcript_30230/g.59216  ORF Transcript_30230/g.59216 Transcript_30230/m.59216 type:complete len:421 (+) Transcript_30230:110-1372(+)
MAYAPRIIRDVRGCILAGITFSLLFSFLFLLGALPPPPGPMTRVTPGISGNLEGGHLGVRDPRQVMLEMHGDLGFEKCVGNPMAVKSPEDIRANRSVCLHDVDPKSYRHNWTCAEQAMRRTYGFSLVFSPNNVMPDAPDNTRRTSDVGEGGHEIRRFRYVEIPKTGSSLVKYQLGSLLDKCGPSKKYGNAVVIADRDWYGLRPPESLERNEEAFAFIRHPVKRFISGYGTIMRRLGRKENQERLRGFVFEWGMKKLKGMKELKRIWSLPEPERFDVFVDHYLELGDGLLMYDFGGNCPLMAHVLSQTWFLNLYSKPIKYIGRTETLNDDYRHFFGDIVGLRTDCVAGHVSELTTTDSQANTGDASNAVNREIAVNPINRREGQKAGVREDVYYLRECRSSVAKLNDHFRVEMDAFGYAPV